MCILHNSFKLISFHVSNVCFLGLSSWKTGSQTTFSAAEYQIQDIKLTHLMHKLWTDWLLLCSKLISKEGWTKISRRINGLPWKMISRKAEYSWFNVNERVNSPVWSSLRWCFVQPAVTRKHCAHRRRVYSGFSVVLQQVLVVLVQSWVVSVSKHSTRLKQRQMDVSPPSPLRTGYTATHGNARRHRHPSVQRPARMTATGGWRRW